MAFTLANVVREQGRTRADSTALVYGERTLRFGELHDRSSRVAQGLLRAGVRTGDRVGVLAKNRPEFFEIAFGCSKADAIVLALNWRLSAPEIAEILADATPSALIVERELLDLLPADRGGAAKTVVLDDDYEHWLASSPDSDPAVPTGPDSVVLLLYSSGTTGRPKGVMLTNAGLAYLERLARDVYRMSAESVHLVCSPLFHIGGAGTGLTTMILGGRTVLTRDATPPNILQTIARERVTHAFFVPAVIQTLVDSPEIGAHDLASLELVFYGASPMTEALLRRSLERLGCSFLGAYGMTEATGTVVTLPPLDHVVEGSRARLLRSVGKAVPWMELRIAHIDTGEELGPGQVGEIQVRSGQTMRGYWNQPETTAKTITGDGWLRTGDGAFRDEEGYVFLQDRIKDMIISGGENIYPAEVENVLADHPAVSEVAVIGVPHERWGETVKAVVVLRPGFAPQAAEIVEFARTRLARYKCPTSIDFVAALPRTPTGKVLKKVLREQHSAGAER